MTKSIIFVSSDSKQDLNYGIVNWSRRGREEGKRERERKRKRQKSSYKKREGEEEGGTGWQAQTAMNE